MHCAAISCLACYVYIAVGIYCCGYCTALWVLLWVLLWVYTAVQVGIRCWVLRLHEQEEIHALQDDSFKALIQNPSVTNLTFINGGVILAIQKLLGVTPSGVLHLWCASSLRLFIAHDIMLLQSEGENCGSMLV